MGSGDLMTKIVKKVVDLDFILEKPCAILIKDEDHSKAVQAALFDMSPNVIWAGHYDRNIHHINAEVLYISYSKSNLSYTIKYATLQHYMDYGRKYYVQIEPELSYRFTYSMEVVEINGKCYHLDDVVRALENIKEVDSDGPSDQ